MSSKFDPSKLKLSQNYGNEVGVKKRIFSIPVRKPNGQEYVRTHPEFRLATLVLVDKTEGETYLVQSDLYESLPGMLVPKVIYPTITRQNTLILWPIRLPDNDGRHDPWNHTALQAAELAKDKWVRVSSNRNARCYDVFEATGNFPEPEWPEMSLEQMLETAFQGHYIETPDHMLLKKLRGEI